MHKYNHEDLATILDGSKKLKGLIAKAKLLEQLNQVIYSLLTVDLKPHCYVANIRQNQLIIATDSAVWATQLRYQVSTLLDTIRDVVPSIANIKISVQARSKAIEQPKVNIEQRHISKNTAIQLESCADNITNEHLRQALKKLASHAAS